MRIPRDLAVCAIRLSLGRTTTAADIETAVASLARCVALARAQRAGTATLGAAR
jgi:cysteine sulfinate desulfinase/cysteine desulfurase-like protein